MDITEIDNNLLVNILPDNLLNEYLKTSKNLKTIKFLITIKQQRILKGSSTKIEFSLEPIYRNKGDEETDLKIETMGAALQITNNFDTQLKAASSYFIEHTLNKPDIVYLKFLNCIIEFLHKNDINDLPFSGSQMEEVILKIHSLNKKDLKVFLATSLLPNYLKIIKASKGGSLVKTLFNYATNSGNAEVLCSLYEYYVPLDSNLLNEDAYWIFLATTICSKDSYCKKLGVFLLSKSINCNIDSPYLLPKSDETDRIWKHYFILLEVSNEKQLHLVKPSLNLLPTVRKLHDLWRATLYKILLNHTQNSIGYYMVTYVLTYEQKWDFFSTILTDVITSLNKNEYSSITKRAFQNLRPFALSLDKLNFEDFVMKCFKSITWTPSALWSYCNALFLFINNGYFKNDSIVEISKKLRSIPNLYIREGCIRVVVRNMLDFRDLYCLNDLKEICEVLLNFNENCFKDFILKHKDFILNHSDDIIQEINRVTLLHDVNEDINYFKILIELFKLLILNISDLDKINYGHSVFTDLIHISSQKNEDHVQSDLEFCLKHQGARCSTYLLKLNKKFTNLSPTLLSQATSILEPPKRPNLSYQAILNDNRTILAFNVLKNNCAVIDERHKTIIDFWIENVRNKTIKNDDITDSFIQFLLKIYSIESSVPQSDMLDVFESVLNSGSKATITILQQISTILKRTDNCKSFDFVNACIEEFFKLCKDKQFKNIAILFLNQIFDPSNYAELSTPNAIYDSITRLLHTIDTEYSKVICNAVDIQSIIIFVISIRILESRDNYKKIMLSLSENLAIFVSKYASKFAEKSPYIFVQIIIKLILYGIHVNKNDKVEYCVYQDISKQVPEMTETNPNVEETAVRFFATDSILFLIQNNSHVADYFVSELIRCYQKYDNKRYFPDSQIHIEKLRILQTILILLPYVREIKEVLSTLVDSFLTESHQASVRQLMQCILIQLLKKVFDIDFILEKLELSNNPRAHSVSALIPVLYHWTLDQEESEWFSSVQILLPFTMGALFKLRIYAQMAIVKLYEKAIEKKLLQFQKDFKHLYYSIEEVIATTKSSAPEIDRTDFVDFYHSDICRDFFAIYYSIPKNTGVVVSEWENLAFLPKLTNIAFNQPFTDGKTDVEENDQVFEIELTENIQKKLYVFSKPSDIIDNFKQDLILVTSLVEKPSNLGGLCRTCEVFGINKLVMKTSKITSDKEFKSLSMSSENWVDIMEMRPENFREFIVEMKKKKYSVIGIEQTSNSTKLNEFKFPQKCVLILGNEKEGIPPDWIRFMDDCIEIPQLGKVRSLNVHVAGAIVMWEYRKQHF